MQLKTLTYIPSCRTAAAKVVGLEGDMFNLLGATPHTLK